MKVLILCVSLIAITFATVITDGPFELDGNVASATKEDWDKLVNGAGTAKSFSGIIADPPPSSIFTTGGSKDPNDIPQWRHMNGAVPDKDQLLNAYAATYTVNEKLYLYFGTDRYANNGDSTIGFWFFKNNIVLANDGKFTGTHSTGDLLILANFGSSTEVKIYVWSNGNLVLLLDDLNAMCKPGATQSACFIYNNQTISSPWPYTPKSGTAQTFPPTSFMEGGIVLNDFFREIPCYNSFLAVSRSSSSLTATLKDFVLNSFNTCKLDVIIDCLDVTIDATKTTFVYTYKITLTNSGFGKLYGIKISYNDQQVDSVAELAAAQQYVYNGQFTSTNLNVVAGPVSAVGYTNSALTETGKLTGTASPDPCPSPRVLSTISPSISCNNVNINEQTEQFEYSFSGAIANTGFGIQTLKSVIVQYNGQEKVINLQDTVLNPVASPTSVDFNGVISTTQLVNEILLVVMSNDYLNSPSEYKTTVVACPPVNINPSLSVTKECHSKLELYQDKMVVNVAIAITVCNQGNIKLKNILLTDHIENHDDVNFSLDELGVGVCHDFDYNYYPNQVNTELTFRDTLNGSADAILDLGHVTASTSAVCGLCPQ